MEIRGGYRKIAKKTCVATLCFMLFANLLVPVRADQIDDYFDDLTKLKKEQQQAVNQLTGIDKQIAQAMYDITELDEKMMKYSTELTNLQNKEEDVNNKIKEYEDSLNNSSDAYKVAEERYAKRLRTIYENGMPTIFDILVSSKGLSDFFTRMTVYTSILEYDKALVGNIQSKKDYINYVKKDLETQQVQLAQLKKDTEKAAQALNNAKDAKEQKMIELKSSQETVQAATVALAKQEEETNKKIDQEIEKIRKQAEAAAARGEAPTTFTGGQFEWPVPGFTIITTRYNTGYDPWNSGVVTIHTGCDIAGGGIFGTPILAIADGEVTLARYYGGYGNCVMINHGKSEVDGSSYMSLYGHASQLLVSQGERVTKGQTIALVGSTGNSTGPHLHLELYKDGKRLDPLSYYPEMQFKYL